MIDILIPTFEPNPEHLTAAIQSVINQTEKDWLLLVLDDHSDSNVRDIVYQFIRDPRVCFMKGVYRRGIGGNWNACLSQSRRPFVQFLFQDDTWHPTYLEEMIGIFKNNPGIGFASADHTYDCEGGMANEYLYQEVRTFRNSLQEGRHAHKELLQFWFEHELHPNIIGEPSFTMLTRPLIERVGNFNEEMPQFLDVEYWLRCLKYVDWYYTKHTLGSFRVHAGGASAQNELSGAGIYDRIECFDRLILDLRPFTPLFNAAIRARRRALVGMARKFFKRKSDGKQTPAARSKKLRRLVLRHPFLITYAALKARLTHAPSL